MAYLTWQNIRDIFTRFKNDDLPRVSNDLFVDFLNDMQLDIREYLKTINGEEFIQTQNITPTSSYQQTALNSNFGNVLWQNTGLYKLDSNSRITTQVEEINPWSTDQWFYISWSNVIISWYEWTTMQLRYYIKMTDLTAITDTTIFDDDRRYYTSIRNMLNMLYNWWLNDDYQEQRSSVKYVQDMSNLAQYLRKQEVNLFLESTYI